MIIYRDEEVTKDSRHDGVRGSDILDTVEKNKVEFCEDGDLNHFEIVVPRFCQDHDEAWIPTRIKITLGAD